MKWKYFFIATLIVSHLGLFAQEYPDSIVIKCNQLKSNIIQSYLNKVGICITADIDTSRIDNLMIIKLQIGDDVNSTFYFWDNDNSGTYDLQGIEAHNRSLNESMEMYHITDNPYDEFHQLIFLDSISDNITKFTKRDLCGYVSFDSLRQCHVVEYRDYKKFREGWAMYHSETGYIADGIDAGEWIYYNEDGTIKEVINLTEKYWNEKKSRK
ncbi:MAG: hypothetical protein IJ342_07690 [Muribaculaceae bacterium]|nr:hypothetical protein [Muribaculaceae bacterium]